MANTDVKKLLVALGLNTKDYKQAFTALARENDSQRSREEAASNKALSTLQKQLDKLKESLGVARDSISHLEKEAATREKVLTSATKELALAKDRLSIRKLEAAEEEKSWTGTVSRWRGFCTSEA